MHELWSLWGCIMSNMEFKIVFWEFEQSESYYELYVDGKCTMEKFARLRFKGELNHKKEKRGRCGGAL
jgi:RNAse (barnase) inhibitor barstar